MRHRSRFDVVVDDRVGNTPAGVVGKTPQNLGGCSDDQLCLSDVRIPGRALGYMKSDDQIIGAEAGFRLR